MEENTSSGGDTIVYNIDTTGIEHRLDAVSETLQTISEPGLDKLFYDYLTVKSSTTSKGRNTPSGKWQQGCF